MTINTSVRVCWHKDKRPNLFSSFEWRIDLVLVSPQNMPAGLVLKRHWVLDFSRILRVSVDFGRNLHE